MFKAQTYSGLKCNYTGLWESITIFKPPVPIPNHNQSIALYYKYNATQIVDNSIKFPYKYV